VLGRLLTQRPAREGFEACEGAPRAQASSADHVFSGLLAIKTPCQMGCRRQSWEKFHTLWDVNANAGVRFCLSSSTREFVKIQAQTAQVQGKEYQENG